MNLNPSAGFDASGSFQQLEQLSLFDAPRRPKPEHVPHAPGSETSKAAAERLATSGRYSKKRERVLELIGNARAYGLTRQEAAVLMGCNASDLCVYFAELRKARLIVEQGTRKNPKTGNRCSYFVLPEHYQPGREGIPASTRR